MKITLTVEGSPQLFAALLALAGTAAALFASDGDGNLMKPAATAALVVGLLFGRLLSGPGPQA